MSRPSAQLGNVVTAMALVALAVTALVFGVLHFSGRAVDRLALESQTMLVERAIVREFRQLEADIQSASIWTDAYEAVARRDADWLLENLGDYYARYMDHEVTLVFGAGDQPMYAYLGGKAADPGRVRDLSLELAPFLAAVRARDQAILADPARRQGSSLEAAITSHTAIPVDGAVYLLGASTILADEPAQEAEGRPHAIVVSGRRADLLLQSLATDLAIDEPYLAPDGPAGRGVTITGPDGEPAGRIVWRPVRPGAGVQLQVMSALLAGGLVLAAASVILLLRIRAILRDLRSNSEALAASLHDLTVARDAAQEASRAKSQFLASMSHEIRTPLNGVLGMAQSLIQDDLRPEHRDKVGLILASGQSLTAVLNDVLDISKIEAGKLELSEADCQVQTILAQTVRLFRPTAEEKGVDLIFDPDPALSRVLRFDKLRFGQCVANLVSNAIKFTPSGSVRLSSSLADLPDGGVTISVLVSDTGIGMSAETLSRLFNNFVQADASTTRTYGGSGLGLAISRRLARLMGGDIVVRSEQGKGSSFTLTVRAEPASAISGHQMSATEAGMPGRVAGEFTEARILIVDDNALNRQIVRLFLAAPGGGHSPFCVEAANGREALDKLEAEPFDLVLLDVHMPVMDGRACIRAIRAAGMPWSSIPVIALTAEAMSGDRESLLACGMTDYAAKPIDRAELLDKVARCLSGVRRPSAPLHKSAAPAAPAVPDEDLASVLDAITASAS